MTDQPITRLHVLTDCLLEAWQEYVMARQWVTKAQDTLYTREDVLQEKARKVSSLDGEFKEELRKLSEQPKREQ